MITGFTQLTLLLCLILFHQGVTQNIIDFSYSEYIKKSEPVSSEGARLSIQPYQLTGDFEFPNACHLNKKLESGNFNVNIESLENYDYITELKQDFIELLKLGQKIKHKSLSIQQTSQTRKLETTSRGYLSLVSSQEMKGLELLEDRLHFIDAQIKQKSSDLQAIVKHSIESSQDNQFIKAAINFDIESYKLKRDYLKALLRDSEKEEPKKIKTDYQKYFQDLRDKFDEENQLIKDLDTILENYNEIGQLKEKISSYKSLIKALELALEDKRECAEELDEVRKSQQNQKEIHILMSSLRDKKKEADNRPNKYCKGVAIKLEERMKVLLNMYDYLFKCAEGKDLLELKLEAHLKELEDAKRRLEELQNNAGIDQYKDKFQQNRDYIKSKNIEIQTFKIDPYKHHPDQIRKLIIETEKDLEDAINRQKLLKASSNQQVDYVKIQGLVDSIKSLKWNYCREYEEYLQKSSRIESKINKFEGDMEYQNKLVSLYLEEKKQLQALQEEFELLRQKIIQKMAV